MKKKIGFGLLCLVLAAIFAISVASAKPHQSLAIADYRVEMPDDAVLPEYLSRLEMNSVSFAITNDFSDLVTNYYKDPLFKYVDENGEEWLPYMEAVKWEKQPNGSMKLHVVAIAFINDNREIEMYYDKDALEKPATGKLERYAIPKKIILKKVPRGKQN